MVKYEFIDHTADIGINAYGKSIAEVFENAAIGMFDIISDTKTISAVGEYRIELSANSVEDLLIKWLSNLLFLHETDSILFSRFKVNLDVQKCELSASIFGEIFDPKKHQYKTQIKAVTYHMLKIGKKDNLFLQNNKKLKSKTAGNNYYCQVLFDI